MKNILVTGGAGFIGGCFVRYLLSQEHNINTLINLDALTYAANRDSVKACEEDSRYQFVQGDITDKTLIDHLLRQYNIDTIVHFAAESHVDRSIAGPMTFVTTNVVGTAVLLEAARSFWLDEKKWDQTQCRFHHISTDEVFGSLSKDDPAFTEQTSYDPRSPYSASKASSDHLARAYFHTYGLPLTISNCSNNYGPYQHNEKLIPTIIRSCLEEKLIPIYGDGSNIRDWLYVEDHCDAIYCILTNGKVGQTYNIGGDCELSNITLAKKICALLDKVKPGKQPYELLITSVTDRMGHDWRYAINHDHITQQLGWAPKTSLDEGLEKTVAFYVNH